MISNELKEILFSYLNESKEKMSPEGRALFEVTVELSSLLERENELMNKVIPMIEELQEIEGKIEILREKGNKLEKAMTDKW